MSTIISDKRIIPDEDDGNYVGEKLFLILFISGKVELKCKNVVENKQV